MEPPELPFREELPTSRDERLKALKQVCQHCYQYELLLWECNMATHMGERKFEKLLKDMLQGHDPDTHQTVPKKKHHTGNSKPKGIFAGTFNMSPDDPYNEKDMIEAVRKLMRQKTNPVKRYAWYLEYTENGLPHIHFIYETESGGRIIEQTFKRCWPIWNSESACGRGHRGGYHKHCADEEAYLKYIEKDGNVHHENKWFT